MEVPSRFEISDELWAEVEPLIPARPRRRRYPGRKAIDDRLVLNGILHVLHTGIAWEDLPREYGYGSGVTCWRRLRTWQRHRSEAGSAAGRRLRTIHHATFSRWLSPRASTAFAWTGATSSFALSEPNAAPTTVRVARLHLD